VLAIVSDTHGTDGHRLEGRTLEAVREADTVVHAGDFTTEAVYDAFAAEANDLVAVHGNNDDPSLVERLPSVATFEREGGASSWFTATNTRRRRCRCSRDRRTPTSSWSAPRIGRNWGTGRSSAGQSGESRRPASVSGRATPRPLPLPRDWWFGRVDRVRGSLGR